MLYFVAPLSYNDMLNTVLKTLGDGSLGRRQFTLSSGSKGVHHKNGTEKENGMSGKIQPFSIRLFITATLACTTACTDLDAAPGAMNGSSNALSVVSTPALLINEVDADQTGTDSAEFVELFDGGSGNTSLDGLVLVLINGATDSTYRTVDLDGYRTDDDGYFVICADATTTPSCDLDVSPETNLIQNGADAVALYAGEAADFPDGSPISTVGPVDALVYDTDDGDDAELLVLLNSGEPQVNENGGGDKDLHSNQRCPNGSGGARNTSSYGQFLPTPGALNSCGLDPQPVSCENDGDLIAIHDVQGSGAQSPLTGETVIVEGVVVGDFQNNDLADDGDLNGFYLQEEADDADASSLTSEGIFVFAPAADDVEKGDVIRVRGRVVEYVTGDGASSMTELSNVEILLCGTAAPLPSPTEVLLPVNAVGDLERFEGMQVIFPQQLTIAEYYDFDRYGEIVLVEPPAGFDRPMQPTAVYAPGSVEAAKLADLNARSRITLDDGRSIQNASPLRHPNGAPFSLDNRFRGGDRVKDAIGVIDDTFGLYRIQPVAPALYTLESERPAPPVVDGDLKVASFNVLNYFTTLGNRGADDALEFTRQQDKIFAALAAIDADIVGLIEIENNADEALLDLVDGLNSHIGVDTYAAIQTGMIGTDEITVAFIYKPETVSPQGRFAVLDDAEFTDPNRLGEAKNRPALAQTFRQNSTAGVVTVVVNHLKSKGSSCGAGDDDPEQGSCNLTRTLAAGALVDWLAQDPTKSGSEHVLIIGDFNAYDKEDPIVTILNGPDGAPKTEDDYTDLVRAFGGEDTYSYVFNGAYGYLDYALASKHTRALVSGVMAWHINADEPDILDYDMTYKQDREDALYEANPYRASDHDPIIIGLDFCDDDAPQVAVRVAPTVLWPPNHRYMTVTSTVDIAGVEDEAFDIDLVSVTVNEPDDGWGDGRTFNDIVVVDDFTFRLRAERSRYGRGRIYTITYAVTNACGNTALASAEVTVPKRRFHRPW
jgi:uncharacterized protein